MGRIGKRAVAIAGLLALLGACSSSSKKTPGNQAGATGLGEGGTDAVTISCQPGSRRCDGFNVKVCDEGGESEIIALTCSSAETCNAGTCLGGACMAGARFCEGGAVRQCDAKGKTSAVVEACPPGAFCSERDGKAACGDQACTPGAALCSGSVATVCRSDGAGPKVGGTDCAETARACFDGQCRDVACTPGTKVCQHDDVYLCGQNGTDLSLWADCQAGEVCDADLGSCRAKLCEPGKATCDGNRAVTCNAHGSGWLPNSRDCAATGQACASGSCVEQVCVPYSTFCQDDDVWYCDVTGTQPALNDSCDPNYERCETYANGTAAYCRFMDCPPGQTFCAGNEIVTCTDQGTYPASGTACADDEYCDLAACKPLDCTRGTYFCRGGDVYYCQQGGPPFVAEECVGDTACKQQGAATAVCAPLACSPGTQSCLNDQIGPCADGGLALSSVTENCRTSGEVCTTGLKCAASASDVLGVAESIEVVYAGNLIADAIDVTSARKLTQIEAQLVLASPRELRWVIYELTAGSYVAKFDKVVSSVSGSGFISSGALNFSLAAGKRYLIGVAISGGDAVAYYDTAPVTQGVSFGAFYGRVFAGYAASYDVGYVYTGYATQLRLTTEAP